MICLVTFLISALMYAVILAFAGIFPFGDNALLISDVNSQFVSFYTQFKHILLTNDNFIYTFSKSLGGDMTGFSGYYLQNPFLFLLLPFPDEYIPAGIVLIIGLQFSLMSVTMALLLKDMAGEGPYNAAVITCSIAYAFMGYNLAYVMLPIYFSSLIMLPLVMLGIRKLASGRGCRLYILSLALAVIFNYYIGYMICIFSVLFFICYLFAEGKAGERKTYVAFVGSSILAGAFSAFTVIPTVLSLSGQKEAPALSRMTPHIMYGIRSFLKNLFTGAFRGDLSNFCAPYIYVGEAVLFCIIIFIMSKKIPMRRKVSYIALTAALLISTWVSTLDIIWHGFNEPVGYAHRFAFLISTVIILMGFEGFKALINALNRSNDKSRESDEAGNKGKLSGKFIIYAIAVAQIVLLTVNGVISLKYNSADYHSFEDYRAYVSRTGDVIGRIKSEDSDFYRIEKDFEYNHNDAMEFSYNGLTHNSSCEKDYVKEFMAKMGIRYFPPIWTFYNQGSTTFTDCFLGVKYFVSRFDDTIKPYGYDFCTEGVNGAGDPVSIYVYKNPYALPIVFGMKESELEADMNDENLFEIENAMAGMPIYTDAAGIIEDITTDDEISVDVPIDKECNLYFYATAPDYQGARP